jgi:D-sedoheptulose 7-phosphate isomerase
MFVAGMKAWIEDYLKEQVRVVQSLPVVEVAEWIELLKKARANGNQIFICGNGGSASNCSHFAVDLGKGASLRMVGSIPKGADLPADGRFRVLSLTDNVAWMTALGNDLGYDDIYVEQLKNYGKAGDILIGVSVSGNSPNIVKAMEWAKGAGLTALALVGNRKDNKMAKLGKRTIAVDTNHYGKAEDAQMMVLHLLCYAFIEGQA